MTFSGQKLVGKGLKHPQRHNKRNKYYSLCFVVILSMLELCRPRGYNPFFMLNSTEHETSPANYSIVKLKLFNCLKHSDRRHAC